jgi:hypothetical protein
LKPVFKITAFLLLCLWLPATQYCTLVAAEIICEGAQLAAPTECCETQDQCSRDACNLFENGAIKAGSEASRVVAPDLSACLCFVCLQVAQPGSLDESVLVVSAPEHSLDWESTWQFVRRAAPLARAPSLHG